MTSTASNSSIDICARALILIGAEPITSFSDNTTEGLVASNMYEDVARSSLTNCRWRFATDQAQLARLTDEPTGRFDVAHQLPDNLLMLNAVTVNDNPINYTVYGDKIFSDSSENDTVIADFIFRASEVDWPSYFSIAVEYAMAGIFASAIARDSGLTQLMEIKANQLMAKARNNDAQQQTTRKLITSRFITERQS